MKALRLVAFGDPAGLQLQDIARPGPPGPTDLLVQVRASGINPLDAKVASGTMGGVLRRPLPVTPGWECAGVVVEVGHDVTAFAPGDAVMAYTAMTRDGTHAEHVLVDADHATRMPASLDFVSAAVVPITAQAAWCLLEAAGQVNGRRLLVQGAGGAVGHWLVQLARAAGAQVTGTAAADDLPRLAALGVTDVVDYRAQPGGPTGRFDLVFDLAGGRAQAALWSRLAPSGLLLSIAQPPDPSLARDGARGEFVFTPSRGTVLADIAAQVGAGVLQPLPVAHHRPLADAVEVMRTLAAGALRGKAVFVP